MYKEYFGLKEVPFSIAPDPHYLYMSENHREALAHLLYGINSDNGFVLLTGEVGTGKTTVCRCLLEQLPENSTIAFILNPKVTVDELLATICDELGIRYLWGNTSNKVLVDKLNAYLLDAYAKGRRTVLILEEAQNLRTDVLEQIRLLTNLETNDRKLLQIIMVGQSELRDLLSQPELRQLQQRITARYHLRPLTKKELAAYVLHRLSIAGVNRKLFPADTIDRLFALSGGIPRMINLLCDRALLGTYVQGKSMVDIPTINRAASEVFGDRGDQKQTKQKFRWAIIVLLLIVCGTALAATYLRQRTENTETIKIEPQRLNVLQWPADLPFDRDQAMAFQALHRKWGVSYKNNKDVCLTIQSDGLRCMKGSGSLNSLMKLNLPAVLKLFDDQEKAYYVTLTGVRGQAATIEVGDISRSVALKELEKRWLGEYTLFWRLPPNYRGDIRRGMKGPDVRWLDTQLAAVQGREVRTGGSPLYDDQLITQVKKFQRNEGLVPDGIVGIKTIIYLNAAAGSHAPKLLYRQGET